MALRNKSRRDRARIERRTAAQLGVPSPAAVAQKKLRQKKRAEVFLSTSVFFLFLENWALAYLSSKEWRLLVPNRRAYMVMQKRVPSLIGAALHWWSLRPTTTAVLEKGVASISWRENDAAIDWCRSKTQGYWQRNAKVTGAAWRVVPLSEGLSRKTVGVGAVGREIAAVVALEEGGYEVVRPFFDKPGQLYRFDGAAALDVDGADGDFGRTVVMIQVTTKDAVIDVIRGSHHAAPGARFIEEAYKNTANPLLRAGDFLYDDEGHQAFTLRRCDVLFLSPRTAFSLSLDHTFVVTILVDRDAPQRLPLTAGIGDSNTGFVEWLHLL
mmetsp:Transcript_3491/g.11455  ORF Transcript_3491/g.11455 Transcript_3491/m.11455 type:complete len:326 (-) Transcript_3491:63-1040(-)